MTKADIIKSLMAKNNLTKAKAQEIVDSMVGMIVDAIASGDSVTITGFGTFKPVTHAPKSCINPRTGERMELPELKSVNFKDGRPFKERLNK